MGIGWDFNKVYSAPTLQNPSHTYASGRYTIVLTVNGIVSETKTDYVRVLSSPVPGTGLRSKRVVFGRPF